MPNTESSNSTTAKYSASSPTALPQLLYQTSPYSVSISTPAVCATGREQKEHRPSITSLIVRASVTGRPILILKKRQQEIEKMVLRKTIAITVCFVICWLGELYEHLCMLFTQSEIRYGKTISYFY